LSFSEQALNRKPIIFVSVRRNGAVMYGFTSLVQYQFGTTVVRQTGDKGLIIESADEGRYDFITAAGHSLKAEIPPLPSPISIQGPWKLEFPKNLGAPEQVTLDRLISWAEHPNPGVRYFSGTASYRNRFTLGKEMLGSDRRLYLDLGHVCVIAEVVLNGHDLGIL
jgi:hypothetical protein